MTSQKFSLTGFSLLLISRPFSWLEIYIQRTDISSIAFPIVMRDTHTSLAEAKDFFDVNCFARLSKGEISIGTSRPSTPIRSHWVGPVPSFVSTMTYSIVHNGRIASRSFPGKMTQSANLKHSGSSLYAAAGSIWRKPCTTRLQVSEQRKVDNNSLTANTYTILRPW